uniref:(northern house mosquito) hypothetical protein n=1 Tax=Culex pipiens TaxID=7175 RepID=A0A8D8K169_CULPI
MQLSSFLAQLHVGPFLWFTIRLRLRAWLSRTPSIGARVLLWPPAALRSRASRSRIPLRHLTAIVLGLLVSTIASESPLAPFSELVTTSGTVLLILGRPKGYPMRRRPTLGPAVGHRD